MKLFKIAITFCLFSSVVMAQTSQYSFVTSTTSVNKNDKKTDTIYYEGLGKYTLNDKSHFLSILKENSGYMFTSKVLKDTTYIDYEIEETSIDKRTKDVSKFLINHLWLPEFEKTPEIGDDTETELFPTDTMGDHIHHLIASITRTRLPDSSDGSTVLKMYNTKIKIREQNKFEGRPFKKYVYRLQVNIVHVMVTDSNVIQNIWMSTKAKVIMDSKTRFIKGDRMKMNHKSTSHEAISIIK